MRDLAIQTHVVFGDDDDGWTVVFALGKKTQFLFASDDAVFDGDEHVPLDCFPSCVPQTCFDVCVSSSGWGFVHAGQTFHRRYYNHPAVLLLFGAAETGLGL